METKTERTEKELLSATQRAPSVPLRECAALLMIIQ